MTWRPQVTVRVGPGGYAAQTPTSRATTYWLIDTKGALHAYPIGQRWAPLPPKFEHKTRADRDEAREAWYVETYWGWMREVAKAIEADPGQARQDFDAAYPTALRDLAASQQAAWLRTQRQQKAETAHRRTRELMAALSADRGTPVAAIAKSQGCAWDTARTRIAAGRQAWATDPAGSRAFLRDALGGAGGDIDTILDRLGAPPTEAGEGGTPPSGPTPGNP